jgi:hypothetical protein
MSAAMEQRCTRCRKWTTDCVGVAKNMGVEILMGRETRESITYVWPDGAETWHPHLNALICAACLTEFGPRSLTKADLTDPELDAGQAQAFAYEVFTWLGDKRAIPEDYAAFAQATPA